jgi:ribosomal 30S subunit maturation factor RimM
MEEYSAYKLVGVNVYNARNEKIGEVKDILLVKSARQTRPSYPSAASSA